jgi:hypothetical protein
MFFGSDKPLEDEALFAQWLNPLRKKECVVYAKRPFAGPKAVFAYLSRYTHRVAISNSRLVKCDCNGVTFRCKNYRAKTASRYRTITLDNDEFIRRFLLHTLPLGFHHILHYGLTANTGCKKNLMMARRLLNVVEGVHLVGDKPIKQEQASVFACPECGGPMLSKKY